MRTIVFFICLISFSLITFFRVDAQNIEIVGDTIEISIKDFHSTQTQWQFSTDKQNWRDIQGGASEKLNYKILESGYFRAKVKNGCELLSDATCIYANTFKNVDTLSNVIYMYYKDSIAISNIFPNSISGNYTCNNTDFAIVKDKLFIKNPNNLSKVNYDLILTNQSLNIQNPLKIKIRCWMKDEYSLTPVITSVIPQFIYTSQDTTYSIENGKLYYSVKNQQTKTFCANFQLVDPMYNQMVCKYGFYAFRTGGKIYVSTNLKNWDLIYDDKRGIKESMVIISNKNGNELLFSEYTAGTTYLRHYLKSYNFKSKELSIRKTFYTTEEYNTKGLTPNARHIHFLVQDQYSNMIFLGTGDTGLECSIYYSNDQGLSFTRLGGGSQRWRSLSMIFTEDYIFWNMDSQTTEYLIRLKRIDLQENVNEIKLTQFPLINNALWCSEKIKTENGMTTMIVMSSNTEGRHYDDNFRNFGIIIKNGEPHVYELYAKKATGNAKGEYSQYSQWYPIGTNDKNTVLFLDLETMKPAFYKVGIIPKLN
jgi:hypothetical protein